MPAFNSVQLMGNLTRDPEVRYTPKGTALAEIGIAINRKWKDQDSGEMKEDVTFVDVTFWGRRGEVIAEHMSKGSPIFITGRLHLDQWEDKATGKNRYALKVVGESFEFLQGKTGGTQHQARPDENPAERSYRESQAAGGQGKKQTAEQFHSPDNDLDQIPF